MSVLYFLTEEEIRLFWGRLTEEQQEAYLEASAAFRRAKQVVSQAIIEALEIEEEA